MNKNQQPTEPDSKTTRRTALKALGATTISVTGFMGTASANKKKEPPEVQFYGCSQVCVSEKGLNVILDTGGEHLECKPITETSNRNDPPVRGWEKVYCYQAKGNEAVVGTCGRGGPQQNENRCAKNYETFHSCDDLCNTVSRTPAQLSTKRERSNLAPTFSEGHPFRE